MNAKRLDPLIRRAEKREDALAQELAKRVQATLPSLVFSDECRTPVLRAKHGDSSGIRGAAWLAGK